MQNPIVSIKKSFLFGLFTLLLLAPLPWLYFDPPRFLQGQPLAVYALIFFLTGISSAALAVFHVLKPRISFSTARLYSLLFLVSGICAYQFSGLAPNWSCFGKQIYVATANAAGKNCTTVCTNNDVKPCSGWSTCWDKFVSCSAAGKDQDGRNCAGCCFSCDVVCEPDPDRPPTIAGNIDCSQLGDNGWCTGTGVLTLTASDPQGFTLNITGNINGIPFSCAPGGTCFQPLPQGSGTIGYSVTAVQSGMSASGSTTWKLDATPPSINGSLSGSLGLNSWYLGPVAYNGSASDSLSGLAGLTCTLDGSALGSCSSISITDEGPHTLVLAARDMAGNVQTLSKNVSVDIQNPNLNANISGILGSNNWYTSATLNASASDPAPGSGIAALEYNLDNSGWITFPASGALDLPEGTHGIDLRAADTAGRTVSSTKSFSLDSTQPKVDLDPSGTLGLNNWYTTRLTLNASASDVISGVDVFEYSLNNGPWAAFSAPLKLNDGTHAISFWAQDKAGLVTQVDETYQVDTRSPQISGSLNGVRGESGWYISQVIVSVSSADPVPGSGLEAFTYILDGDPQATYTNPLVLSDGIHTIQFDAWDVAGLSAMMQQTIKVDTTPPSLNIQTSLPAWNKGTITLEGIAGDSGSGLFKVEISTDGGSTWQAVTGTDAWSFDWNTSSGTSGVHQVRVRSTDNSGLTKEQVLTAGVDNNLPKISLPDSWFQWETVTLDVWDNDSGLSEVRVEISDPDGRWKTRKIDLNPSEFPLDFKWDRYFGDGTVAPLGTYPVKVFAYDKLGNLMQKNATVKILLGILPAGPMATAQPYVRVDTPPIPESTPRPYTTPTAVSTPLTSIFGSVPEVWSQTQDKNPDTQIAAIPETIVTPRSAPTKTSVMEWLENIFIPETVAETVTEVSTPETDPLMHWGASLVAMAAAMAAYSLAEKRKREEEERPLSNLQQKTRAQKTQEMKNKEALMSEIAQAQAEQKRLEAEQEALKTLIENNRTASKEELLEKGMKSLSAKPQEWQAAYNVYMSNKAMDKYREGEKEVYNVTPKEKSWWEKTLNWVDNHQVEISLGIGAVVGVAALVLSGGAATPLVAAAWIAGAAAVAGGTVALGTMGLNAYNDRPFLENVGRNLAVAGMTAAAVTGAGFLFQSTMTTATIYCANNTEKCAKIEPLLNGVDYAEQAYLQAKLGYQIWVGDTYGALETQLEIEQERMDGGMPGNTVAHQIDDLGEDAAQILATYGDDALPLLLRYSDDAVDIIGDYGDEGISLLQMYGDDAINIVGTYGDDGVELLTNHGNEVIDLLKKGSPTNENWTNYIPEGFQGYIHSGFDGEPIAITLNENVSVYRYWSNIDGDRGRWVTLNPNLSPDEVRSLLALPSENYASNVTQFVIPKGTTILVGKVAEQTTADWAGAYAVGGGFQIFVPDANIMLDTPLLNP